MLSGIVLGWILRFPAGVQKLFSCVGDLNAHVVELGAEHF